MDPLRWRRVSILEKGLRILRAHWVWEGAMSVYSILMSLIMVGVILWAINTYIPMDGKIRSILNAVIVILVLLWLLQGFSGYSGLPRIWITR